MTIDEGKKPAKWLQVSIDSMGQLSTLVATKQMAGAVLLYLMEQSAREFGTGAVLMQRRALANHFDVSMRTITDALSFLRKGGWLESREPSDGSKDAVCYILDKDLCWTGKRERMAYVTDDERAAQAKHRYDRTQDYRWDYGSDPIETKIHPDGIVRSVNVKTGVVDGEKSFPLKRLRSEVERQLMTIQARYEYRQKNGKLDQNTTDKAIMLETMAEDVLPWALRHGVTKVVSDTQNGALRSLEVLYNKSSAQ